MSRIKILVVEDESIVAMDIKNRAESLGYEITNVTPSGEEAIRMIKDNPPDLVLMDIVLKGKMDGIEAAQKINDKFGLPVLFLTAYSDEETLKRAKVTEPFGYIIKPFENRELHSAIEIAIYKHQMEKKLKESEKWLSITLKSIGDAVIATDERGIIKFMNPVAWEITGWSPEEAIGKNLTDIIKIFNADTGVALENPVNKVLQEDSIIGLDVPTLLINRKGARLFIDDSSSPIRDENGNVIGVAMVFRDITDRKKAEKEKEELLKEKARGELSSFVLSAFPVFASNIPPQIRNNIAKNFADRFEENMKYKFQKDLEKCIRFTEAKKSPENVFKCYIHWLSEFFSNLGIETKVKFSHNYGYIKFLNCPWIDSAEPSPIFCMICRVIVIRSFNWTSLRGNVEQTECIADAKDLCGFDFVFKHR